MFFVFLKSFFYFFIIQKGEKKPVNYNDISEYENPNLEFSKIRLSRRLSEDMPIRFKPTVPLQKNHDKSKSRLCPLLSHNNRFHPASTYQQRCTTGGCCLQEAAPDYAIIMLGTLCLAPFDDERWNERET